MKVFGYLITYHITKLAKGLPILNLLGQARVYVPAEFGPFTTDSENGCAIGGNFLGFLRTKS